MNLSPTIAAAVRTSAPWLQAAPRAPLADVAGPMLHALCVAAGFAPDNAGQTVATLRELMTPWGLSPVGANGWTSDIADDTSPVEFSLSTHGGHPEVRMMLEAQGDGPTLRDQLRAGLAFNERLAQDFGANIDRFRPVARLFAPDSPVGRFGLWHSACFSPGRAPSFKLYLNPQIHGRGLAREVAREALTALGFARAWDQLVTVAGARGDARDELKYLALDLTAGPAARVKVYFLHHGATPDELLAASRLAPDFDAAAARAFVAAMTDGAARLDARAPYTCHALLDPAAERPAETNLYVPAGAYARDDREVCARFVAHLRATGGDAALYLRALEAVARRPLAAGPGIHSYVASSRRDGAARTTVYLSPELMRTTLPARHC